MLNRKMNEMEIEKSYVFIIENNKLFDASIFNRLLNKLPERLREDISKYHKWQDRQAVLLGKLLLIKGLKTIGRNVNMIQSIQKDTFQRPFLKGLKPELDFNISHSEGVVVCAVNQTFKVGIDIELIQPIILNEYEIVFTKQEFQNIQNQQGIENQLINFFKYWTRKEAVMKADGRGFYLTPSSFETVENEVVIENQKWYLKEVAINTIFQTKNTSKSFRHLYRCHIATSLPTNIQTYLLGIKDFFE
jgi:4'-phosphopantetheinyl transferase